MVASLFATQQPAFVGIAPSNIFAPVVSGDGLVGGQLTCDPGAWEGIPSPEFTYQWKRNGVVISGATGSTYTTVEDDAAQQVSCTVTATNFRGSASKDSNSVTIGTQPVNTATPVVTGTAIIGQTLTSTDGTWEAYPAPTFTYEWLRQGLPIQQGGSTTNEYTLQDADEGSSIQCRVTATNFFGSTPATSNAVGPVTNPA